MSRNRQRNKQSEAPVAIQRLKPGEQGKIPDDGYLWRKYGNKPIKTASYKRYKSDLSHHLQLLRL